MVATFSGLAATVIVIVLLFVWPGFLVTTHCNPSSGTSESVDGRTYCYVSVAVPLVGSYASHTVWGFTFRINELPTPAGGVLNITVMEPNGTWYAGSLRNGGPPEPSNYTTMWFTPDNESGVSSVWGSGNASLLVERGY